MGFRYFLAESNFLVQDFFEQQVKPFLKIDVYDFTFDKGNGYSIIEHDNMKIFIYRVEKIPLIYRKLAAFLDAENPEVPFNKKMLEDYWLRESVVWEKLSRS